MERERMANQMMTKSGLLMVWALSGGCRMRFIAIVIPVAFCVLAADPFGTGQGGTAVGDLKQEMARFAGSWSIVKQQVRGETQPPAKQIKFIFIENSLTVMDGEKKEVEVTFKVDPSKSPKTIDILIPLKGGTETLTRLGIYEFD